MKQAAWICPSILSANFAVLGQEITTVMAAGAHRIHIDVMDNHYVPNLSFGPLVCESLRKAKITAPFDVHLMVEPVDELIKKFIELGVSCIVFHPEASRHVHRSLSLIKSAGIEAGLVLNPGSAVDLLDPLWESLDRILVMSVNPGFGGQKFIPAVLNKIKILRKKIDEIASTKKISHIRLEVDGGVNLDNISEISAAGADTFVMGNAIFKPENGKTYQEIIQTALGYINK